MSFSTMHFLTIRLSARFNPWLLSFALALGSLCLPVLATSDHDHNAENKHGQEAAKGSHNGRLLEKGDFSVELAIFEQGVPPEYRAWASVAGKTLQPGDWQLSVRLTRLGGKIDTFTFLPAQNFLRSQGEVKEPHSFDVTVTATYKNQRYQWTYPSYEGRVTIAPAMAKAAGISTASAGAGELHTQVKLYGKVVADPARISHIQARYPGVVRSVKATIGSHVKAGDVLASIESNESLRQYTLVAPIDGIIIARHANPGEFTGERTLFTLADYSHLELDLQVFPADIDKIATGQPLTLSAGKRSAQTRIDYLTPHEEGAPTLVAHAAVDNTAGLWVPNQAVEASVSVGDIPVPLLVDNRALQEVREWQVVFINIGDTYEIRPLELGRSDGQFTEVLGGLNAGDSYVVDNSYLLKADLEKSGAAHEH